MRLTQIWSDPTGSAAATIGDIDVAFERVVQVILGLAGIVLFILLLMGGFKYITAAGDPKALEGAKKTLTFAILGFVLVACALLILRFIEEFTGVNVTQFSVTPP